MKRAAPLLFLFALATVFCWRSVFLSQCPYFGDVVDQFMPWKFFSRMELLEGRIPLWTPYHFGGSPFLANMQSAVFYPVDLLLLPFSIPRAFAFSLWIHTALAGFFAYALARDFRVSRTGSVISGAVYMLNGFAMIHIFAGNLLTVYGAVWIPLMILLGKRVGETAVGENRTSGSLLRTMLWGGPVVALQILAGHPQMAFYSFLFAFLFALLTAAFLRPAKRGPAKRLVIGITLVVVCLGFGALLSSIQVLPTLEYALHSSRHGGLDFDQATEFTLAPQRLLELFVPEFFGTRYHAGSGIVNTFWDPNWKTWSSTSIGTVAFILALCGFFTKDENPRIARFRWILLGFALCALGLALGPYSPLFRVLFQVPGFKDFRAPSKYTPYLVVCLSVLAGAGLDRVLHQVRKSQRGPTLNNYFLLVFLVIVAALLGALAIGHWSTTVTGDLALGDIIAGLDWRAVLFAGLLTALAAFTLTILPPIRKRTRIRMLAKILWYPTTTAVLLSVGLLVAQSYALRVGLPRQASLTAARACEMAVALTAAAWVVLFLWRKDYLSTSIARFLLVALVCGELLFLGYKYIPQKDIETLPQQFRTGTQLHGKTPGRVIVTPSAHPMGKPEQSVLFAEENICGYDPMQVGDFYRYIAAAEDWPEDIFRDSIIITNYTSPAYDLLDVRNVLRAGGSISKPKRIAVNRSGTYPHAFWLPREQVIHSPTGLSLSCTQALAEKHRAVYWRLRPTNLYVKADCPGEGYVFLSEVFFPGWEAFDDKGEQVPIRKVNGLFRLLPVRKGTHVISLNYRPISFRIGYLLTIFVALVWLGVLAYYFLVVRLLETSSARRRSSGGSSTG